MPTLSRALVWISSRDPATPSHPDHPPPQTNTREDHVRPRLSSHRAALGQLGPKDPFASQLSMPKLTRAIAWIAPHRGYNITIPAAARPFSALRPSLHPRSPALLSCPCRTPTLTHVSSCTCSPRPLRDFCEISCPLHATRLKHSRFESQ